MPPYYFIWNQPTVSYPFDNKKIKTDTVVYRWISEGVIRIIKEECQHLLEVATQPSPWHCLMNFDEYFKFLQIEADKMARVLAERSAHSHQLGFNLIQNKV